MIQFDDYICNYSRNQKSYGVLTPKFLNRILYLHASKEFARRQILLGTKPLEKYQKISSGTDL